MNAPKSERASLGPCRLRRGAAGGGARPTPGPRVFIPQGYEPAYDYPLLVWLAAPDARFDLGRAMARTSLRNFIAVQPAPGGGSERIWRAVDRVAGRLAVHPRRVYLVGVGDLGTEAFRHACRHPDDFAGVVSLGGAFPLDEGLFAPVTRLRRLPMLLCCGRDAAERSGAAIDRTLRLFHAAGATLALRIYPGRDELARATLADVNRWVMEDVCGASTAEPTRCAP